MDLQYPLIFALAHRVLAALGLLHGFAELPLDRVYLHPMAIAVWVGMFATSLNLLPGGQLDGGHIVFSIAPRAHSIVSRLTILVLIPCSLSLGRLVNLGPPARNQQLPSSSGGRMAPDLGRAQLARNFCVGHARADACPRSLCA